jgi:hypothetical protein
VENSLQLLGAVLYANEALLILSSSNLMIPMMLKGYTIRTQFLNPRGNYRRTFLP